MAAVSTIALYGTPPSSIHTHDFETLYSRSTPSTSSPSSTSSSSSPPLISSSLPKHSPLTLSSFDDDVWHTRSRVGGGGGFGRVSALGSCLEYNVVDELTFGLDDDEEGNGDGGDVVGDLLALAQSKHEVFREGFVVKAFWEAEKAHRGQVRATGHPYLQHCMETAMLLATVGSGAVVVAAGLLHDTMDDCSVTYDYILSLFGSEVANLVQQVSKLSHFSKLARENNTAHKAVEADNMHNMLLAMDDPRAVLIKLADRLHNMLTLEALPVHKQQRFAKETLEIFVPLANRLCISTWKVQLENLCFKHLYDAQHEELSSKIDKSYDEAMIPMAIQKLERALKDEKLSFCDLSGRHKSLYSIYRKMLKKKLTIDEIHDIHGLRLIVDNKDDCFKALKVVHRLWSEVPGSFKNYIDSPKENGYRSLHTVVEGEGRAHIEVQIRTMEMHLQAENGFAAHWRYKEGDCKHSSYMIQRVQWARWVLSWRFEQKDISSDGCVDSIKPPCKFPVHSEGCPYSFNGQCSDDGPVYVILIENEKMSVQEFPPYSSMMDVLQRTGYGSPRFTLYSFSANELRPRLNDEPVTDPACKLKMGDVIELTPAIPDKSLPHHRERIKRLYDRPFSPVPVAASTRVVGWTN